MKPHIFFLSLNQEIEPSRFTFLLSFVREDKRKRILGQKGKRNADTMLVGELLAMYGIQKIFGIPMREQKIDCGEKGKPFLVNRNRVFFNISHSENCVAVVVCDKRVGIDIQHIVPYRYSVAKRICTQEELLEIEKGKDPSAEFTKLWTRKEALVKMKGCGMRMMNPDLAMNEYDFFTIHRRKIYLSVVWDETNSC